MGEITKAHRDYIVPALKKGLQILEMFSARQQVLTLAEIAHRLDLSTSAIYRTVVTLVEMGYLKKVARNVFELGPMVLSRGFSYLAARDIVTVAVPLLDKLRDDTSASSHLAIREGIDALYLYRAVSPQLIMVNIRVGTRLPCYNTAIGLALLVGLDNTTLRELYSGVALDGRNGSIQSLPQLLSVIETVRESGISINSSGCSTAFAAPVRDYHGNVVAAINVSVPDFAADQPDTRHHLQKCLRATACSISAILGWEEVN